MFDTFLSLAADGVRQLYTAIKTSSGVSDANKIIATGPDGLIHPSLIPGTEVLELMASEDISAGDLVNYHYVTGVRKIRKADNTNGRQADAYVKEAITTGDTGFVYEDGTNSAVSGKTSGTRYYLGVAGAMTDTPPINTDTGKLIQFIGEAVSPTEVTFEADDYTVVQ